MSHSIRVPIIPTGLQDHVDKYKKSIRYTYIINEFWCCVNCDTVVLGHIETLPTNLFFEANWMVNVDKEKVLRLKLLHSECEFVSVSVQLKLKRRTLVNEDSYSDIREGESKYCYFPDSCQCGTKPALSRQPVELVLDLFHDSIRYKDTNTLQPHISKFARRFRNILDNADMSDAVLVVENKEFRVHKAILAAQIPAFISMLNDAGNENRVTIDDIDSETMKQLLLYIYMGDILTVDYDQVVKLLKQADKYALEELKVICTKIIRNRISIDNVFTIISMAEQYKLDCLKKAAIFFIFSKCDIMLKTYSKLEESNLPKTIDFDYEEIEMEEELDE